MRAQSGEYGLDENLRYAHPSHACWRGPLPFTRPRAATGFIETILSALGERLILLLILGDVGAEVVNDAQDDCSNKIEGGVDEGVTPGEITLDQMKERESQNSNDKIEHYGLSYSHKIIGEFHVNKNYLW